MPYQIRILYEAALALAELGLATKPQFEQENGQRRQRPALLKLPADLGLRFALNRNHLRSVAETWEEKVQELRKEHKLNEEPPTEPGARQDWISERLKRIEQHERAVEKAGKVEVEWSPAAKIQAKQLGEREGFSDDWLAKLLAVGIIVMDDEAPIDTKKGKKGKPGEVAGG